MRRFRFTLAFFGVFLLANLLIGSPWRMVPETWLNRWGFSLDNLTHHRWFTLFTSVWFAHGPNMFLRLVVLVLVTLGSCEYALGTRRTIALYFLLDAAGTVVGTLLAAAGLALLHSPEQSEFLVTGAVGMSAGGFGCLGAAFSQLRPRLRWSLFALGMAVQLVRLIFFTELSSDTIHLLTFPAGFLVGLSLTRGRARPPAGAALHPSR